MKPLGRRTHVGLAAAESENDDTALRLFRVNVPDAELADLRRRVAATRWPTKELVEDRSQGVQLATLRELARYWTTARRSSHCVSQKDRVFTCNANTSRH